MAVVAGLALGGLVVAACGSGSAAPASSSSPGVINAIGAENEYANVLGQIGGEYVHVSSILNSPNTDPHTYESSPSVAQEVSNAQLIVQNGVGYDTFMNRIESASPSSNRKVIVVQNVLGHPPNTQPAPVVRPEDHAGSGRGDGGRPLVPPAFSRLVLPRQPGQVQHLAAALVGGDRLVQGPVRRDDGGHDETVADYLLTAMGINNLTPFAFQADIMNGVDPTPQDITLENGFFTQHRVKVFCYNQQVVSNLTVSVRQSAQQNNVPIVGVYETMPTPGYDYQTWMLAEVHAIEKAITSGTSTEHL